MQSSKLQVENDTLLKQLEGLTLEKADMLRQIADLTEKWQQCVAENAWLNRENIALRSTAEQLRSMLASGSSSIHGSSISPLPGLNAMGGVTTHHGKHTP